MRMWGNAAGPEIRCYFCSSFFLVKSKKRRTIDFFQIRNYFQCRNCKGYSLFPKLTQVEIESLYSVNYIRDVNPDLQHSSENRDDRFKELFQSLDSLVLPKGPNFLDYGCGANAEVVIRAANLGFNSFGLEVEESTRSKAQIESDCKIFSLEEVTSLELHFDIIFLGDVLEHLNDPRDTLTRIYRLLRPTGILIVQGPLEAAPTISNFLLSIKSIFLNGAPGNFPPYHVSLATRKSILEVLNLTNFRVHKLKIFEPLWPAPRFGSKASISSFSSLVFSLTKLFDIVLSRWGFKHGTRFYLEASKSL